MSKSIQFSSINQVYNCWKSKSVALEDIIFTPPEPTLETAITTVSSDVASVVDSTYFSYEFSFGTSIALDFIFVIHYGIHSSRNIIRISEYGFTDCSINNIFSYLELEHCFRQNS
ncbi:unnamed protein product [Ambrosiozyma monospora]|uniref:Unnamed protein product n=1 Tax=Ambrosiozyma monospora TaxID=43982 RepID=A0A9W6YYX4_AMBMO|nr:unnamed protein product [Ambrosiozyma monospora]